MGGFMERIKELYEMGVELAKKPQYDKARECFEKCLEIDPNYIPAYYQLLIDAAIREDLKTFLDICKTLKKTGDPKVVKNANYYLLMFQFILGDNYERKSWIWTNTFVYFLMCFHILFVYYSFSCS